MQGTVKDTEERVHLGKEAVRQNGKSADRNTTDSQKNVQVKENFDLVHR